MSNFQKWTFLWPKMLCSHYFGLVARFWDHYAVGGVFGVFFQIVKKISENGQINVQFWKKIFQFEKKLRISTMAWHFYLYFTVFPAKTWFFFWKYRIGYGLSHTPGTFIYTLLFFPLKLVFLPESVALVMVLKIPWHFYLYFCVFPAKTCFFTLKRRTGYGLKNTVALFFILP
jgi:hypothetical protein